MFNENNLDPYNLKLFETRRTFNRPKLLNRRHNICPVTVNDRFRILLR